MIKTSADQTNHTIPNSRERNLVHLGPGTNITWTSIMFSILKIEIFPVEHNPFDKFVANRFSDHSVRCVGKAPMLEVKHICIRCCTADVQEVRCGGQRP
jgi:hypothetical protein